jgi:hypothetical protein
MCYVNFVRPVAPSVHVQIAQSYCRWPHQCNGFLHGASPRAMALALAVHNRSFLHQFAALVPCEPLACAAVAHRKLRHNFWQEIVIEYLLKRPRAGFRQGAGRYIGFVKSHETGMRIILVQDGWKRWS